MWFPSNTYTVLDSINIGKKINTAIRDTYKRYDSFVQRGSGWVLKKVSKFSVSIMKFKLFQGGCLSTLLPKELCKKCCCVSIKNIPKTSVSFTVLLLLCVKILRISIERVSNMVKLLNYYCYIVGLGPNCKFIDLLFKCLVITFIKISFLNCFIVSEIIYSQTDTLTEELMYLR